MNKPKTFKVEPHDFGSIRGLSWPVCKGCGLVRLRNPLTDWCIRHGCNAEDAPGYKAAVANLAKPPAAA